MVLHPLPSGACHPKRNLPVPAWQAVEHRQRQSADQWWLVTQPDHAVLAGDLAARLDFPSHPPLSPTVIRAIAVHDAGWARFDHRVATAAPAAPDLPLSFLGIVPSQFLMAWRDSIEEAERIAPIGGIIVSEHFRRLAQARLSSRSDSPEDVQRLQVFLRDENSRQRRLRSGLQEADSEVEFLTDVLQFCDLASLYLCCGADEPAEFPQQFGGARIGVRRQEDAYLFTPPVFGSGTALGVSARSYPGAAVSVLPFLLS